MNDSSSSGGEPTETVVSFATGAVSGTGRVQRVDEMGVDGFAVVVDQTPFHPVDHTWPDQPGDSGTLADQAVTPTAMGAVSPQGKLLVGGDIPVRRGEPGWAWCVVHVVAERRCQPGQLVSLEVDPVRRGRLSAAHTSCHLAALAMNAAAAGYWRKQVRVDALGNPDLDQLAMRSSRMDEAGSTDVYRFGKSLRKQGFESVTFVADLAEVVAAVRSTLAGWVGTAGSVSIVDEGDRRITAPRRWTCELPEGLATIPCGGTHVASLSELGDVFVAYEPDTDGTGLTVRTTPHRPFGDVPAGP